MPLAEITEKISAENLAESCLRHKLNQAAVAKEFGVTHQAINQQFHKPIVQRTLQELINRNLQKAGITYTKVYKKLDEQLDATKVISAVVSPEGKQRDANGQTCDYIEVPDNQARDRAIEKSLTLMGHLKKQGEAEGVTAIQINFSSGMGLLNEKEAEVVAQKLDISSTTRQVDKSRSSTKNGRKTDLLRK